MSWRIVDSAAQADWVAATSQTTQLEGLRDAIGSAPRFAVLGGSGELARVTVPTPTINTETDPYQLEITGFVPSSHVHAATGNPATAEVRTSGGTVILRADAGLAASGATVEFAGAVKERCPPSAGLVVRADSSLPATYIPSWRDPSYARRFVEVPMEAPYSALSPHLDASINPNYPGNPEYMSSGATSWSYTILAWCSWAFDRATNEILAPINGGHGDYAGSDSLRGRLNRDVGVWERIKPPAGWDGSVITNDQARLVSGSGTTVVLPAGTQAPLLWDGSRDEASATDDAYNGMTLSVFGQSDRTITDYVGSTRTATVSPAFAVDMADRLFSISDGPMVMGLKGEQSGRYSDGSPRPVHTYNLPVLNTITGNAWIPVGGSGPSWTASQGYYHAVEFDRETGAATIRAAPTSTQAAGSLGAAATFDPTRGTEGSIWYYGRNGSRIIRLDCAADTWHQSGPTISPRGGEQCLVYLPDHDLLLMGGTGDPWMLYDPVADTYHTLTTSGTPAGGNTDFGRSCPEWVPAANAVYWWDGPSGHTTEYNRMVIPASPKTDTWVIEVIEPHEDNEVTPVAAATNGTYKRGPYSPSLDGFFVVNDTSTVYFYCRAALT
jgi:hypothetical protein